MSAPPHAPGQTQCHPDDDHPLPQLPSPTLTNIDMVLPIDHGVSARMSPPRTMQRPPSPSYLRDATQEHSYTTAPMGRKEKLGLVSRKMMLLRGRTSSNGGIMCRSSSQASTDLVPSSPVLQDVGNLAPEQLGADFLQLPEPEPRRASGSSSSGLSGMTGFLDKYGKASDEDTLYDSSEYATPGRAGRRISVDVRPRPSLEEDPAEMRRRQQQEEYESAILSKRAEEILANAKKRLNVMEGNLRGARDLVQPLTAANLKRATSLSGAIYGNGRTLRYDYDDEQTQSSPRRGVHSQHSSPQINHDCDYQRSDRMGPAPLPDRPYTSLDLRPQYMATPPMNLRNPLRSAQQTHDRNLRSSRSHEQLMANGSYGAGRSFYIGPPVSSDYLEPLTEDEERQVQQNISHTPSSSLNNGLGIYRPSSRTSELRDQMSSLKGKISTLKERAREDSLRRHSQTNLRHQSPFNNAATTPPEMFYCPPPTVDPIQPHSSADNSPAMPTNETFTGSRNAFAEQENERAIRRKPGTSVTIESKAPIPLQLQGHRRTSSGTAIVEPATNRYSHHQHSNSGSGSSQLSQTGGMVIDLPSAQMAEHEYLHVPQPNFSGDASPQSSSDEAFPRSDEEYDPYEPSEADASVYEDAKEQISVVAHEDREDAFDYEHFFLHSAMGSYSTDRRGSQSSAESEDSGATARGPALVGYEDDDFYQMAGDLPPTPQTPERLREIERNLHQRSSSTGSGTTMYTFATAHEHAEYEEEELEEYEYEEDAEEEIETEPVSPMEEPATFHGHYPSRQRSVSPVSPLPDHNPRMHVRAESYTPQATRSAYHVASKYQRNVQSAQAINHPDSVSERADSGVSITSRNEHRRQQPSQPSSTYYRHRGKLSNASAISTPPLSPHDSLAKIDPTTVAVQALLDPNGRQLGLRNKAVLFGVVESLRKIVRQMQEEDDATFASRMLRNTLDEAKRTLDGL
ncbi:hypothetical protein CERZMDRAFT_105345 [Cercospora zeae-maydis SCOH1-5]|uniref:Uncharacterized protein n=1 Tax=Cercospora zeae-maydis SCOH1-5 TaxID=717836 RepID=A0A6A6FNT1_9PEZI|nr:hypothetical protein CERZMDRAFT_105345 [Cercospora zeae-maydis SCOH1-5]